MIQYLRRASGLVGLVCCCLMFQIGCGGSSEPQQQGKKAATKKRRQPRKRRTRKKTPQGKKKTSSSTQRKAVAKKKQDGKEKPRLVDGGVGPTLNDNQLAGYGIRKLEGQHLTLYTDLPPDPEVDELPKVFSAALLPWCRYFRVDYRNIKRWKPTAYIIQRREKFQAVGALRPDLPPFKHGFQVRNEVWVYEQPSSYYRRHLLLHEGTHAFMDVFLGGTGPPWYMEGIAEYLGTHRWKNGRLLLALNPASKKEVPRWARVRLIKDAYEQGRGMSLEQILKYGSNAHLDVEPYAWCWAAVVFFQNHPSTRMTFQDLSKLSASPAQLTRTWRQTVDKDWVKLNREWQLFITEMEYGYDVLTESVRYKKQLVPLNPQRPHRMHVSSRSGWQSTGIRLDPNQAFAITAQGRYQLAQQPQVWWSEPRGVTIRYHRGQPLGKLLAAVCDERSSETVTSLTKAQPVGMGGKFKFAHGGTLFLKINDSPAERHDNQGAAEVSISLP